MIAAATPQQCGIHHLHHCTTRLADAAPDSPPPHPHTHSLCGSINSNSQAHLYDQYRHRMLHGRKPMMLNMPAPKDGVWVDLGGGTGANMEYFRVDDAIRNFSKVRGAVSPCTCQPLDVASCSPLRSSFVPLPRPLQATPLPAFRSRGMPAPRADPSPSTLPRPSVAPAGDDTNATKRTDTTNRTPIRWCLWT